MYRRDAQWPVVRRRHMIADLSRGKLTLQRSQNSVLLYGCSCLSAINEASLLKTTVAVDLNPPVRKKMVKKKW